MTESRVHELTDAPLHKIVLVEADGVYYARPSYPIVSRGNRVRFLNYSGTTIDLDFRASPGLFVEAERITLTDGQKETLTVGGLADGHYRYGGATAVREAPLVGESSPEIIIDG